MAGESREEGREGRWEEEEEKDEDEGDGDGGETNNDR